MDKRHEIKLNRVGEYYFLTYILRALDMVIGTNKFIGNWAVIHAVFGVN